MAEFGVGLGQVGGAEFDAMFQVLVGDLELALGEFEQAFFLRIMAIQAAATAMATEKVPPIQRRRRQFHQGGHAGGPRRRGRKAGVQSRGGTRYISRWHP